MRVRRFFYVRAPNGRVRHIQYGKHHSEGVVACGRHSRPGWRWTQAKNHLGFVPVCPRCIDAGHAEKTIHVERVRRR